jgi:hypothetical protein
VHGLSRRADRNNQTREAGAGAEIGNGGSVAKRRQHLPRIEKMSQPDIRQRGRRHKIDLGLPFFQKSLIDNELLNCFARNIGRLAEAVGGHAARFA